MNNIFYIVANDAYAKKLVIFLESWLHRLGDFSNLICGIDNADSYLVKEILNRYGVKAEVVQFPNSLFDNFLEIYDGNFPQVYELMKVKFLKLHLFNFQETGVIYGDIDGFIANESIKKIIDHDFQKISYYVKSEEWSIKTDIVNFTKISTSFFTKPRNFPNLKDIIDFIKSNKHEFNEMRVSGVVDQPVVNYYLFKNQVFYPESIHEHFQDFFWGINTIDFSEFEVGGDGISVGQMKLPYIHHSKNFEYSIAADLYEAFYKAKAIERDSGLIKLVNLN